MVTPLDILAPGGTLIVASACSEGFGSPEFRDAQRRLRALGPDAFLQTLLAKAFADVDEWQTEMQLKSLRAGHVQLYTTGLDDEERSLTGVEAIASVEAALAVAIARSGDPAIAVVPEGPYVVPVVA
jgi:nickel-dependent lactate racemase